MRSASFVALTAAAVTSLALLATPTLAAQATPSQDASAVATAETATPTDVRFATFNVRTSRADIGTSRQWLRRALSVAQEIKDHDPGIVAIQELGPGRADGVRISVGNGLRQTTSLLKALESIGAGKYQLTRTTSYVKPGTYHGTQGPRILLRHDEVPPGQRLRGDHREVDLECILQHDHAYGEGRAPTSAAYAEFEDRATGRNFFVISTHLDSRHGSTAAQREALRLAARRGGPRGLQEGEQPRQRQADHLRRGHQLVEDQNR